MSAHSWHHYSRWEETHPAAPRPHDDLRSAKGIARAVVGGIVSYAAVIGTWVAWHG